MNNYKAKIEREELVEALAFAVDKGFMEEGLSTYGDAVEIIENILKINEDCDDQPK
jgi:hypothetical protein